MLEYPVAAVEYFVYSKKEWNFGKYSYIMIFKVQLAVAFYLF